MRMASIAAALLCATDVASAAATESLSLEEAVALADRRNPEIVALRQELEELRTRTSDPTPAPGAGKGSAKPGSTADLEARLRRAVLAAAEARFEHRRVLVAAAVRSAFARCSAGRALRKLSEDSGVAANEMLRLAEERRSQGRESAAAIEHARLALARARQENAAIEQALSRAVVELLVLLGAPVTESLVIKGALPVRSVTMEPFDSLVTRALRDRADLRATRIDYEAALDAQSLAAKLESRPNGGARRSPARRGAPAGVLALEELANADADLRRAVGAR